MEPGSVTSRHAVESTRETVAVGRPLAVVVTCPGHLPRNRIEGKKSETGVTDRQTLSQQFSVLKALFIHPSFFFMKKASELVALIRLGLYLPSSLG